MNVTDDVKIVPKIPEEQRFEPQLAAVELQKHFACEAKRLRPRDLDTQEDLIQEMSHLILRCPAAMTLAYFKTAARLRAINYLRYEDRRRKIPSCLPLAQRTTELSEDISEEDQLERDEEEERRMLLNIFKKASRLHKAPLPEVDGTLEPRKESA
jgi:hypothetical protein